MSIRSTKYGFRVQAEVNGDRVVKTFPTYEEAVVAEVQAKQALREGRPMPFKTREKHQGRVESHIETLGDAYKKVWKTYWVDGQSPHWQRRHMNKVLGYFGDIPVAEVTSEAVADFTLDLKGKGLANSTINHSLQSLRKVLGYCCQTGILPMMPFIKNLRLNNARTRYLNIEECAALREATSGDLHDALVFSLLTGVRKSELFRLEFRHVSGGFVYIEQSKNGHARCIPAHQDVLDIISDRKQGRERTDIIFTDSTIDRVPWETARERLGLNGVVWHTLRHTFASLLVQKGVDITVVKELMGHRTITTTMRYAKLAPKNFSDAINLL